MERDQIFVSYSHRDRKWLDELTITLAPLIRKRSITVWDDTKIGVGQKWKDQIKAALDRAKVAVLLVTRGFLASEFIANEELPRLLQTASDAGLTIVWIAVGASLYEETEITEYQAANDPSRPLNSLSDADLDRELVGIAKKLNALLGEPAGDLEFGNTESVSDEMTGVSSLLDQIVQSKVPKETDSPGIDGPGVADDALAPARRRIREELADSRWSWRSIHALSGSAGLDENATLDILRADPLVRLARSKSGKVIAQLKIPVRA
jgi:TIR domain